MNIFICDDENNTVEFLEKFLEKRGHNVQTSNTAKECINACKKKKIDLVFLDIILPGESGVDALAKIKEANKDTIVVMMTGCALVESETHRLGAFEYLYKPFDLDKIEWILERVSLLLK